MYISQAICNIFKIQALYHPLELERPIDGSDSCSLDMSAIVQHSAFHPQEDYLERILLWVSPLSGGDVANHSSMGSFSPKRVESS